MSLSLSLPTQPAMSLPLSLPTNPDPYPSLYQQILIPIPLSTRSLPLSLPTNPDPYPSLCSSSGLPSSHITCDISSVSASSLSAVSSSGTTAASRRMLSFSSRTATSPAAAWLAGGELSSTSEASSAARDRSCGSSVTVEQEPGS